MTKFMQSEASDLLALVSIGLFIAAIAVWCQIGPELMR